MVQGGPGIAFGESITSLACDDALYGACGTAHTTGSLLQVRLCKRFDKRQVTSKATRLSLSPVLACPAVPNTA
jgi:hypothetical protein